MSLNKRKEIRRLNKGVIEPINIEFCFLDPVYKIAGKEVDAA